MRHRPIHSVTLCLIAVAAFATGGRAEERVEAVPRAQGRASDLVQWTQVSTRDYESTQPGLGFSRRYVASVGWADVYVYDGNHKGWLDGLEDPAIKPAFDEAVDEVAKVAGPGVGYRLTGEGRVVIGGRPFFHASMRMRVDGREVESHVYLTAAGRHLVKFRISLYQPARPGDRAMLEAFIAAQVEFVLSHPYVGQAAAAPLKRQIAIQVGPGGLDGATGPVWLCYALARADYWTHSGRPLPSPGELEPGFQEELGARLKAVEVYRDLRKRQPGVRSSYWDALEQVDGAGFLSEYVWTYLRHASWSGGEEPSRLAQFDVWRRTHLVGHTPETRCGLIVQVVPATP